MSHVQTIRATEAFPLFPEVSGTWGWEHSTPGLFSEK
jgi:hypothetical protein